MAGHLIVDGHNLARSGAVPLSGAPGSAEERDDLCAVVSSYAREKGFRLTIVFDGRGSGNPARTRRAFKGGAALFSSRSETADDVIRELSRGAPPGTVAVTNDRGLAGTLPARVVTVISCGEFAARLFDHRLEEIEGGVEDEPGPGHPGGKKGEGRRLKKRERKRNRLLGRL